MKSILLSVKPKYVAKILNGEKTIEVRKCFPKDYKGWVYIYCTKEEGLYISGKGRFGVKKDFKYFTENAYDRSGKVVARFYCDTVEEIRFNKRDDTYYIYRGEKMDIGEVSLGISSCLSHRELNEYLQESNGYAIHISQLEIFDKPKELREFNRYGCKDYDKDVCEVYGKQGHLYTNCFFHLTKAPQPYMFIEVEE